jgi:hypothetical protein
MNWNVIDRFIEHPHVFGHYLGFEDLIETHSEWIKSAWLDKSKNSLQAHRNSYKTTSVLIVGAIWYLLFWEPEATILIIRKSDLDAQKIIETIKQLFESKEIQYVSEFLYGVEKLKTDNWSKRSLTISLKSKKTPEGSIESKGTTSSITGSHYDFILPDDIITLKDRVSKAEREWIKEFIRELRNIKKESGKIFFSGTPWHKDDAWTIIPTPEVFPIGSIKIKGYTDDVIEQKKTELREGTTRSLYCANYDMKHVDDEDKIFSEPRRARCPELRRSIGWLDTAYGGGHSNALTILGQSSEGEWFVRGWVWYKNIVDIYNEIVDKMVMHNAGTLYVESNADKGLSVKDLRMLYPSVEPKWEKKNKHIKIISYAKKHWNEIIFADDCNDEYLNQILDYTEGEEPDDAPDSLASALRQAGFSGHSKQKKSEVQRNQILGW